MQSSPTTTTSSSVRGSSESPSPVSSTHFNHSSLKPDPAQHFAASPISPTSPLSSTSIENSGPSPPGHAFYRASKHVRVEQTSQSIKGTFRFSPLAPDSGLYPPLYDLPKPDPKCSSSAEFKTKSSAINVELLIVSGNREQDGSGDSSNHHRRSWHSSHHANHSHHGQQRHHQKSPSNASSNSLEKESLKGVWVNAKSHHGAVKVKIPQYVLPNPLSLRLKSHSGNIILSIPPSFSGVISFKSESGTLKLSPRMQPRWKALGNEVHKHRGVGRIGAAVSADDDHVLEMERDGKRGDSAELITKMGNIFIEESGEDKFNGTACTIM